jgi:pilus assembly protein Flp/PilA
LGKQTRAVNGPPGFLSQHEPSQQVKKQKIKKTKNMEERKMEKVRNFFKDESGATMVEYGVMVALIAAICVTVVGYLGQSVSTKFNDVNTAIQ